MALITVTCPWPPVCLTPNQKRRAHWSKYRGPAKQYREECFWLAKQAIGRTVIKGPPIRVQVGFFPPDARLRDDDNIQSAFKHGRDGIADAFGHDDRTWKGKVVPFFHEPFRPNGQVIVQIEVPE